MINRLTTAGVLAVAVLACWLIWGLAVALWAKVVILWFVSWVAGFFIMLGEEEAGIGRAFFLLLSGPVAVLLHLVIKVWTGERFNYDR